MKINKLLMFALGCFVFASCSDDDYTPATHGLDVTSAETSIDAAGGTKTIATAATGVTAYSNDSWLAVSVDGSNVNVTAPQNNSIESRNTTVVIKSSAEDSAIVNVSQYGVVFQLSAGTSIIVPSDAAYSETFAMKHNVDVTLSTSADWLSVIGSDDSLTVNLAANNTGHMRVGYVYYQAGASLDSIMVKQYDFDADLAGTYYWVYTNSRGTESALYAILTSDTLELTNGATLDLAAPISFDEATATVSIQAGSYWGTYGNYHVYNCFIDAAGAYWTAYYTNSYATLPFDYDDYNGTHAIMGGTFGTNQIAEMDMEACSSKSFSSSTDLGALLSFIQPYMLKLSGAGAKALKTIPEGKVSTLKLRK